MDRADLDPLLLDPTRLTIVSLLSAARWAEFGWVRDQAGLSDSALSKQVGTLARQGYVETEKGYVGKRPRTWLNLSEAGRAALEGHLAALQRIADTSRQAGREHRAHTGPERQRPAPTGPERGGTAAGPAPG